MTKKITGYTNPHGVKFTALTGDLLERAHATMNEQMYRDYDDSMIFVSEIAISDMQGAYKSKSHEEIMDMIVESSSSLKRESIATLEDSRRITLEYATEIAEEEAEEDKVTMTQEEAWEAVDRALMEATLFTDDEDHPGAKTGEVVLVSDYQEARGAMWSDLVDGIEWEGSICDLLDRHGIKWK